MLLLAPTPALADYRVCCCCCTMRRGGGLALVAVAAGGGAPWETDLPFATLRSVLPGREHLVLLGETAGGQGREAVAASVMLADGAVEVLRFVA